ncbi:MAG: ABC transporter permease subunit [Sulfuricellaceae bacterium]|nr:ABC transporter permease subunit [Sulfuricellaceae bacterium]
MILTLAAKELKGLFGTPLAWSVLAVLQAVLAYIFLAQIDSFLAVQPQLEQLANPPGITEYIVAPLFASAAVILLMATPLLSMRLIAEERRNRTLSLLLSAPLSMTEIVLGKFFGLLLFLALIIGLALAMALGLYAGGSIDLGLLAANLLGLLLLASCFAALGLYFSTLTDSPSVAGIASLGASLGLWVINMAAADPDSLLHYFSLLKHFESFNRGLIDSGDGAFFLLFSAVFLVFSIRRLDGERLRG